MPKNKKGGTRPPVVSKFTCVIPVIFRRPGTLGQNTSGKFDVLVSPEPVFLTSIIHCDNLNTGKVKNGI